MGEREDIHERKLNLSFKNLGLLFGFCFLSGDGLNKIPTYGVVVVSNPSVCDVCIFIAMVFGEISYLRCRGFLTFVRSKLF